MASEPAEVANQVVKKPTSEMELVDLEMYIEELSSWNGGRQPTTCLGKSIESFPSRSCELKGTSIFFTFCSIPEEV